MNPLAPPDPPTLRARPTLAAFLRESDDGESRRILGELITENAQPLVRAIVRRRLGPSGAQDFEDVCSRAVVSLLTRLDELRRSGGAAAGIADFDGYVAVVATHACDDAIREKRPARVRLRNRLRYLFSHTPDLALWPCPDGRWGCGLAASRNREPGAGRPETPASARLWESDPRELLRRALRTADEPFDLDVLVAWLGETIDLRNPMEGGSTLDPADPGPSITKRLTHREYLERIWREILDLPVRQRVALLLNLRDARTPDVIAVLPHTGVASIRKIAEALEMPALELARLWNDLPLEDQVIATRMGVTRQQVINLRKAARARLARRMGAPGAELA